MIEVIVDWFPLHKTWDINTLDYVFLFAGSAWEVDEWLQNSTEYTENKNV